MGFLFIFFAQLCLAMHSFIWPYCVSNLVSVLFLHYSDTRCLAMKRTALNGIKQIKDTHLYNLESEDKEYRISCDAGLYFRVSPKGKKSWQVRFKDEIGKWHSLGLYSVISLADEKFQCSEIFLKLNRNEKIMTTNGKISKS